MGTAKQCVGAGAGNAGDQWRAVTQEGEMPTTVFVDVFGKFRVCLDAGHTRISAERLFDRLKKLETISARKLTAVG